MPDPTGRQADGIMELKEVGTMTVALLALPDWLVEAGITHVATERTGEYWKPVYNILEGDFTVFLVNAAHAQQVPGRKTAKSDARWLAKLMRHGLVQASFIPPVVQRDLRDLTRYRTTLVQERSRQVNRVQGVLERANIKLASVATEIMGLSGRAMLRASVEGRADAGHDGRVGPRADAEQDSPPGAGPDRAGPRPSPPVVGAAVGVYRVPGRTARHSER